MCVWITFSHLKTYWRNSALTFLWPQSRKIEHSRKQKNENIRPRVILSWRLSRLAWGARVCGLLSSSKVTRVQHSSLVTRSPYDALALFSLARESTNDVMNQLFLRNRCNVRATGCCHNTLQAKAACAPLPSPARCNYPANPQELSPRANTGFFVYYYVLEICAYVVDLTWWGIYGAMQNLILISSLELQNNAKRAVVLILTSER